MTMADRRTVSKMLITTLTLAWALIAGGAQLFFPNAN